MSEHAKPECTESKQKEWPSEERIDTVGQNGNDGEHYAVLDEQNNDE